MLRFSFHLLIVLANAAASAGQRREAAEPIPPGTPTQSPTKSLDLQFLDDLPTSNAKAAAPPNAVTPQRPSQPMLDPSAGSDVGQDDPLKRISARMRIVEQRLRSRDVSLDTQVDQQRVLVELDAVIEELASQLQAGGQQSQGAKAKPGEPVPGKTSNQAGNNSGNPSEAAESNESLEAAMRDSLGGFWGHLPERIRRQMQNAQGIEFLPKYRKLIEDYYRRLAEDRGNWP